MAKSTPSDRNSDAKRASDKNTQSEVDPVEDAVLPEDPDASSDVDPAIASSDDDVTDAATETDGADPDNRDASVPATTDTSDSTLPDIAGDDTIPADNDPVPDVIEAVIIDPEANDSPADDSSDTSDDPSATQTPSAPPVAPRKGGFFPLVLGGLVAGGIGFGAATYLEMNDDTQDGFQAEVSQNLNTQSETIDALSGRIDAVESAQGQIDPSALQNDISGNAAAIDAALSEVAILSESLADFATRLDALEKQPLAESVSPEAIAAYERELEDLRTVLDDRKAEIEELVANERAAMEASVAEQRATIEALAAAADQAEASAEEKAALAAARNAMVDVTNAARQGAPFEQPLAIIRDTDLIDIPDILNATAPEGVVAHDVLEDSFPDLADTALMQARKEKIEAEGNSLSSFLETQLGGRSVVPREGDDPDAILSRAEAAVKAGDLQTALDEIAALPDSVQPVFAEWVTSATTRKDVLAATAQLAQDVNQK